MLEIKKIQLKELAGFIESKTYRQMQVVPISPARANSYLLNPAAKPDDVVLYLAFMDKKLVAFRSLFADIIFDGNEQIRFGWCSGNWVHPNFRRKGFSEMLLKEAFADWNKKLMFTNYASASEQLYLKTGRFYSIHQFEGVRAYLFPKTQKLIQGANKNGATKLVFSFIDFCIFLLSNLRLMFFTENTQDEIQFEVIDFPDKQCFETIKNTEKSFYLRRGEKELKWIFENPWISTKDRSFEKKYPFSSFSNNFFYKTVKVFEYEKFTGFFIFSVRKGHLKTLFFSGLENSHKIVAEFLKNYCVKEKIDMATIYNSGAADLLFQQKFPFLRVKKFGQHIYSSFKIQNDNSYHFQDGDGDVFFT